ncbi:hypothetical protein Tco_0475926 [Tanacetum coccineum]
MTHPSGSGIGVEKPLSVEKITPTVTSEGTGDKPGVPDVTEDDSTESESESWEQDEESDDDYQEEEEVDQENESEDDEIESDEDKGMDDTTDQFDDDVDARLEEPTQTGKEIVHGKGADVEMDEAQQGNENLETTQEQVVNDAHVTITTVTKKTGVPVTSSSRSSDLASKLLNFSDTPQTDTEIVSPLDVYVHHEVPRTQAPTLTILVSVITESSPIFTNIPQSSQTFTPPPILTTPTLPPTIETTNPLSTFPDFASQVKDQQPQILPKEVSNLAPPVMEKLIKESRDEVTLAKVSSQPQSTYEAASTLTEFELKKILLDKMEKSESYLTAPEHRDCYDGLKKSYALDKDFFFSYDVYSLKRGRKDKDKDEDPFARSDRGLKKRKLSKDAEPTIEPKKKDSTSGSSKGTKSQPKSSGKSVQSEEPVFEVADSDMPHDQEGNIDFSGYNLNGLKIENLTQGTRSNYAELEYEFKECYKALLEKLDWENPEGGDYPFDLSKPLPLITRVAKTEKQRKSFYAYARGIQSRGDVYSTKRILAVTHVKVMRKHGYGYLEEIVVRRADNVLCRFKEGVHAESGYSEAIEELQLGD